MLLEDLRWMAEYLGSFAGLRRLFRSEASAKVGFALLEDLDRLEDAMPGVLEGMQNVTDLQRPATRALGLPRRTVVGLSKSCASLCGIALDQTQQRTDWQARPLSAGSARSTKRVGFDLRQGR